MKAHQHPGFAASSSMQWYCHICGSLPCRWASAVFLLLQSRFPWHLLSLPRGCTFLLPLLQSLSCIRSGTGAYRLLGVRAYHILDKIPCHHLIHSNPGLGLLDLFNCSQLVQHEIFKVLTPFYCDLGNEIIFTIDDVGFFRDFLQLSQQWFFRS